ncbi:hypothetical protein CsatB_006078 [Cannabis sativa]
MKKVQNSVYAINNNDENWVDNVEGVRNIFLEFYWQLLGTKISQKKKVLTSVVREDLVLNETQIQVLSHSYSKEEIKSAIFSILNEKVPGLDGFISGFLKNAWDVVGEDFIKTISSSLNSGKIFKEINTDTLTLIPKMKVGIVLV